MIRLGKLAAANTLEEISAAGYDMPCILDPLPEASRLVMFYKDKEVVDQVEVPAGEDITVRCSDIGKYRLEGLKLSQFFRPSGNPVYSCTKTVEKFINVLGKISKTGVIFTLMKDFLTILLFLVIPGTMDPKGDMYLLKLSDGIFCSE